MAGDIATRYVRIRPDTTGFKQETNRQVEDALKGVKRTIAATLGGAGVYEILKSTFEAAAQEQSAVASIQLAVKNAGSEWVVYGKTVAEILNEQEHAKGFDLPEEAQAFGRLEQQTKNTKLALQDLDIAMDVARARHLQLAQVATALSRLEGGNAQSLSRLGIITDKYTGSQDALKAQIRDVTTALSAQAAAHQKSYDGQTKVTASQAALLTLSKSELKQREADLKAQLAGAAASDKQITTDQARAELLRRYSGQADVFAHTAAGQLAILHTSIEQVQQSIGTAFLPLLTEGAKSLGDWAYSLSKSESFLHGTATAADDLGDAISTIGTAIQAIEPLLSVVQDVVGVIGVGPILAFVAAWKLLPPVLALAGTGETALSADTVALQASIDAVGAGIAEFQGQLAALGTTEATTITTTEGLSASQTALVASMDALIVETDALFAADEQLALAQLQLTSSAELAVAAQSTFGEVTAGTIGQHEAAAAAIAEEAAAADALAASTRAAGASGAAAATGLGGLLGPLALLAGGLYFVHQHFDEADHSAQDFHDTLGKLQDAVRLAKSDVAGASIARDQASDQLAAARDRRAAALDAVRADSDASVSVGKLASDQAALRDTTLSLRSATHAYAQAVSDLNAREADRAKGVADSKRELALLTGQVVDLAKKSQEAAGFLASHGGDLSLSSINTKTIDLFVRSLEALAKQNPSMEAAIRDLEGIAKATGKIPDRVTIGIILNPTLSTADLTNEIVGQLSAAQRAAQAQLSAGPGGLLGTGGLAPIKQKSGADFAADFEKAGGVYPAEVKVKVKKAGDTAAADFSTSFVQHIDVGGIADAISQALSTARSNIVTQSDSIATVIGNALDERLRRTTLPLTREIDRIQASLDAEQASSQASDAANAVTDAAAKLAQLKSVYGSGALTAGQATEIRDAENALADAQRTVGDQAKQARIKTLQDQIDAAGKAEDLRKQASSRNLSDLADEFNRGKISQAKYLDGVRKVLADQKVSFKSAGALLGVAFADGFGDSLKELEAQVRALTGPQRKGSTLSKPTSVTAAGSSALQAVIDQIAQSGGRFSLDNVGSLPKGVNVASLVAAAKDRRAEESYRVASGKHQEQGLQLAQESNAHLERIAGLLKDGTHVVIDGSGAKKKTRATAKATQS